MQIVYNSLSVHSQHRICQNRKEGMLDLVSSNERTFNIANLLVAMFEGSPLGDEHLDSLEMTIRGCRGERSLVRRLRCLVHPDLTLSRPAKCQINFIRPNSLKALVPVNATIC